jgi:hypothetical protein
VAREAAKILAKLFPSNIAPINFSVFSVNFKARTADFIPLSAFALSLLLLAAVKAVSDPEKKPDRNSNKTITTTVRIFAMLNVDENSIIVLFTFRLGLFFKVFISIY